MNFDFMFSEFDLADDCTNCQHNPKETGKPCDGQCLEEVNGMPLDEFILRFAPKTKMN